MPFFYDEMQSSHYNYVFYCLDMLNLMFSVDSTGIFSSKFIGDLILLLQYINAWHSANSMDWLFFNHTVYMDYE